MKVRKIIALLLSMSMLAGMSVGSFADDGLTIGESEEKSVNRDFNATKEMLSKNAEYLTIDEILSIARVNINAFISDEITNQTDTIYPSEDFISVFDLYGNVFAYLVPLNKIGEGEVGYIIVGALEDGFTSYSTNLNSESIQYIRKILSESSNSSLIMIPPFAMVVKMGEKYYDISSYTDMVDMTSSIKGHELDYIEEYSIIRKEERKKDIKKILDISEKEIDTFENKALGATLRGESNFVNIGGVYYGCNQAWVKKYSDNGCGPAAAANTLYYMSDQKSSCSNLYPYTNISKTNFTQYLETVGDYLDPSIIGMMNYSQWASKVKSFASAKGVSLSYKSYPLSSSQENCEQFIFNGLRSNSPIATLNAHLPVSRSVSIDQLKYHWITITKFNSNSAGSQITFSTWGRKESFNFDTYYAYASRASNSGLVYFVY